MHAAAVTDKLIQFLAAHEGYVSKCYRCPGGELTIGYGFTMGSRVFAEFWQKHRGRKLQMGDTITRAESDMLLKRMVEAEYTPPVDALLAPPAPIALTMNVFEHVREGAISPTYNLGQRALTWKWAQALALGDIKRAATLLRTTGTTANGQRLPGLVRRRDEEATIIETGRYAGVATVLATPDDVTWYQRKLATLGFYKGPVNGDASSSDAAVRAYQQARGLTVDGKVGPATRATIIRDLDARFGNGGAAIGAATGASTDVATQTATVPVDVGPPADAPIANGPPIDITPPVDAAADINLLTVVLAAVFVGLVAWGASWVWRNRRRIFGGGRIPT